MAVILRRMFSNSFSCKKIVVFCFQFHQKLLPRVWLIINQHWFRQWLGADQAPSHYLTNDGLVYRRIYVSLGLNELRSFMLTRYKLFSQEWQDLPSRGSDGSVLRHKMQLQFSKPGQGRGNVWNCFAPCIGCLRESLACRHGWNMFSTKLTPNWPFDFIFTLSPFGP